MGDEILATRENQSALDFDLEISRSRKWNFRGRKWEKESSKVPWGILARALVLVAVEADYFRANVRTYTDVSSPLTHVQRGRSYMHEFDHTDITGPRSTCTDLC